MIALLAAAVAGCGDDAPTDTISEEIGYEADDCTENSITSSGAASEVAWACRVEGGPKPYVIAFERDGRIFDFHFVTRR